MGSGIGARIENLQEFESSRSSGHLYSSLSQKLSIEGRHVHAPECNFILLY